MRMRLISGHALFLGFLVFIPAITMLLPAKGISNEQLDIRGEFILKFKLGNYVKLEGVNAGIVSFDSIGRKFGLQLIEEIAPIPYDIKDKLPNISRMYFLKFPVNVDANEVIKCYSAHRAVEYIVENSACEYSDPAFPNDYYFMMGYQWGLFRIDAPLAWDIAIGSEDEIIAILDTGVDWDHEDLGGGYPYINGNIWINWQEYYGTTGIDDDNNNYIDDYRGWNFHNDNNLVKDVGDYYGHGTPCAGIAAAMTNNSIGMAGVTWNNKIMILRVGTSHDVYKTYAVKALTYAIVKGARVASMSFGWIDGDPALEDALDDAYNNGILLVASTGNYHGELVYFPARYEKVIGVGATLSDDTRWSGSNYGEGIDVTAPGGVVEGDGVIFTTGKGGVYILFGGTSAACPHVSGLAALMAYRYPNWENNWIKNAIEQGSDDLNAPEWDKYTGWGRINAYKSLSFNRWVGNLAEGRMDISPILKDIDYDGKQEIFVCCDDGNQDAQGSAYAFDSDWNPIWEKDIQGDVGANPCVSDLDNNGTYEFIVATLDGYIYVFNANDGSDFQNWPKDNVDCSFSSPATADLDNDGFKEIVIGTESGLKIYSYDGTLLDEKWTNYQFLAGPVIVDVDTDGDMDILAIPNNWPYPIWFDFEGGRMFEVKTKNEGIDTHDKKSQNGLPDVPLLPQKFEAINRSPDILNFATPAVADIDNDGWYEMISINGDYGSSIVRCDRIWKPGESWVTSNIWYHEFNGTLPCISSPIIANIDDDDNAEIIVAGNYDPGINYIARMAVRCLEHDGNVKWARAIGEYSFVYPFSSPALGNADDDDNLEIVIGSDWGKVYTLDAEDGSFSSGLVKYARKMVSSTPLISDFNNDGKTEIITTAADHFIYCWQISNNPQGNVEWGTFHHNNHNTGVYLRKPENLAEVSYFS